MLNVNRCGRIVDTDDWDVIVRSPMTVFYMVANADGNIDRKEANQFNEIVAFPGAFTSKLFSVVLVDVDNNFKSTYNNVLSGTGSISEYFGSLCHILDTYFTVEEVLEYKRHLMMVGLLTAQASGGGFLGLKNPVSEIEAVVLFALTQELGLMENDFVFNVQK